MAEYNNCAVSSPQLHVTSALANTCHDRYTESVYNNITYWPLDYPPMSGYQAR
jgi:hypothetical protein